VRAETTIEGRRVRAETTDADDTITVTVWGAGQDTAGEPSVFTYPRHIGIRAAMERGAQESI
jgi:hypothetical protein